MGVRFLSFFPAQPSNKTYATKDTGAYVTVELSPQRKQLVCKPVMPCLAVATAADDTAGAIVQHVFRCWHTHRAPLQSGCYDTTHSSLHGLFCIFRHVCTAPAAPPPPRFMPGPPDQSPAIISALAALI